VPMLQHASLEDDDRLRERWAALLANAASPHAGVNVRPVMAETLKQLTPLDAELMDFFYNFVVKEVAAGSEHYVPSVAGAIAGVLLPEVRGSEVDPGSPDQPRGSVSAIDLSLASLVALGLVTQGRDPLRPAGAYYITIFGFEFVTACREPKKAREAYGGR